MNPVLHCHYVKHGLDCVPTAAGVAAVVIVVVAVLLSILLMLAGSRGGR